MIKTALTGGIGTGKTFVADFFKRIGIPVFYADTEAKKLYNRQDVLDMIRQQLGERVFIGQQLSLAKLTQVIFSEPEALEIINNIIHPLVFEEFEKWGQQQQSDIVIMESAIVFEGNLSHYFDYIITVDAPIERRLSRLRVRDTHIDEATLLKKIDAQLPQEVKCHQSHFVIHHDTNDDADYLQEQINHIIQQIKAEHHA